MKITKIKGMNPMPTGFTGIIAWPSGTRKSYLNGKLHRVDGPAVEYSDGSKEWFLNDTRHRVDGPAIENPNGTKEYWIHDKYIKDEKAYWIYANMMKLKGLK